MSIMRMRRRFAVHLRYILYVVIGVFIIGLPLVFAPGGFNRGGGEGELPAVLKEPIAEVDGATLTRADLERSFKRGVSEMVSVAQMGGPVGAEYLPSYRLQGFEKAVLEKLVLREAEKQGIKISDRQVSNRASALAKQELDQYKLQLKGKDLERALAQVATATDEHPRDSMSERAFLRWRTDLWVQKAADDLRAGMATEELQKRVTASVTATEKELLATYDQTTLREIVVALHPPAKPARSDGEARKRADELLARVKGGADFAELARTESDDEEASYTGGLRSPMAVSSMSAAYQQAVGSLKAGNVAPNPIKTDRGYVIVKVDQKGQKLPEDFQKNKQQYLRDFTGQKRMIAWQAYETQLRSQAKVKIVDSEILGYQEVNSGHLDKAVPLLQKAVPSADQVGGLSAAAVHYQLAICYSAQNQWKEAAEAYRAADDYLNGPDGLPQARGQVLMGLARSYENLGNKQDAAKYYQSAGENTEMPSIHEELMKAYLRIGNAEGVKREQEWSDEYNKQQAEQDKALQEQQRKMEEEAAKKRPRPAPSGP